MISVPALDTMSKLKNFNGYVRLTLEKLPGVRTDLVKLDEDWQEWHSGQAFILTLCHVCDAPVKLNGLEFHGRKSINKLLLHLVNKLSTNTVAKTPVNHV